MREYGSVSPRFWIGETGKQLRGDVDSQLLALYLMTSPHSHMTGIYHCPLLYMAHETGLSSKQVEQAMRKLVEIGFCEYEADTETVFVVRMAAFQIGEALKPGDKRIAGLRRDVERMPSATSRQRFLSIYGLAFQLIDDEIYAEPLRSPFEAPSKPLDRPSEGVKKPHRSQEQEQEQEQEYLRGAGEAPKASVVQMPEPVIVARLPLVDGSEYKVVREKVGKWAQAYPAVQVERELAAMASWLEANPRNRKTPAGIERFVVGWLGKAQDRAARTPGDLLRGAQRDDPFAGAK